MKLQAYKVDDYVAGLTPATTPLLVLVYGTDQGGVRAVGKNVTKAYLGADYDPLQYVSLDESALAGQPGRLGDEAAAVSMFGGARLVVVSGGGGSVPEAAKLYLEKHAAKLQDAMVIIEASNLKPSAALRKLVEQHDRAMALPCYALEHRDIAQLARRVLEQEHYRIDAQALDMLVARLATDRGIIQRELERLVLYKGPRRKADATGMITANDIDAALGDQTQADFDRLIDNIALGRLDAADRALARLGEAGTSAAAALVPVRMHFQALHLALGLMDKGVPQNQTLSRFKPPLHFRRKPMVEEQLRLWSTRKCARALDIINTTERDCRGRAAGLQQAHAGQALLRIARAAKL